MQFKASFKANVPGTVWRILFKWSCNFNKVSKFASQQIRGLIGKSVKILECVATNTKTILFLLLRMYIGGELCYRGKMEV